MPLAFSSINHVNPAPRAVTGGPSVTYTAAVLCWMLSAGVYVAAKYATADMPPWTLTFLRPLIAGVILLPLVVRHLPEMLAEIRARPLVVLVVGGLGLAISQGCIYTGLQSTTAVNAGLIMALAPIITLLVAHIALKEPFGPWQIVGSIIALFGMIVIISKGDPISLFSMQLGIGDIWILLSAICFAAYSVLLRWAKFDLPRLPLLVLLLGAGALTALPFFGWELLHHDYVRMDRSAFLALAYVAIPGGALMYYLYNYSVEALGAAKAGVFMYLQIFFVAVLAWLLLGERLYAYHYTGAALIILGVVLVTVFKPVPRPAAA